MVDQLNPIGDMDLVTEEILVELAAFRSSACLSMFLPTHSAGRETQQDPIRFMNLVRAGEASLLDEHRHNRRDVEALLTPVRALADDVDFWRHQSDGLAVFVAHDVLRTFRVPLPLAEALWVGEDFACAHSCRSWRATDSSSCWP